MIPKYVLIWQPRIEAGPDLSGETVITANTMRN
jgi:hypothetical protein